MIAADDLDRSGDLLQRGVVKGWAKDPQGVDKRFRLLRGYTSLALAEQQRIKNLE